MDWILVEQEKMTILAIYFNPRNSLMEQQSPENVHQDVQELVCESVWFSCLISNLQFE
jgi:hypothetical protein